jgi:hypothetical protein
MTPGQKQSEEAKRERNWDPKTRWMALQQTIAWAEQQSTVRRNTREACLAEQTRKLAWLDQYLLSRGLSTA